MSYKNKNAEDGKGSIRKENSRNDDAGHDNASNGDSRNESAIVRPKGALYLCGTPIGNLGDASSRLKEILAMVDLIAAEDTRESVKLLNRFEIKNKLFSYHEHNKRDAGPYLVEKLLAGDNVALVSDAGMPGISDPGEDLVKLCIEANIEIVPVPGPSAAITALVVSGLPCDRFAFEGFLPKGKKEKKQRLEELKDEVRTMIFYEAPHRLLDFLEEIIKAFGDRDISVSRELTKKFEEHRRGKISEILGYFREKGIRGEFVVVVKGSDENFIEKSQRKWDNITVADHVQQYIEEGLDKKDAMKQVSLDRGIPKREIYNSLLDT